MYVVMIPLEKPKVGFMDSCSLSFIFFFFISYFSFFPLLSLSFILARRFERRLIWFSGLDPSSVGVL